jgi:hypothetical protein
MRKNRSRLILLVVVVLVIIVILAAALILANSGSEPSPLMAGVKAGDTFTYELEGLWESDDPNATISDAILDLNMTDWYQVTITNVSDPEILLHTVWRFKNGTELEADGRMDIETGFSSGGFWAIYAANLDAGELTHPQGPDQVIVNSTVTSEYPSGSRETNRLLLTAQYYNVNDPSRIYSDFRTIQFDKQTGILVDFRNQNIYNSPEKTETILWKLTDSNVWTVT